MPFEEFEKPPTPPEEEEVEEKIEEEVEEKPKEEKEEEVEEKEKIEEKPEVELEKEEEKILSEEEKGKLKKEAKKLEKEGCFSEAAERFEKIEDFKRAMKDYLKQGDWCCFKFSAAECAEKAGEEEKAKELYKELLEDPEFTGDEIFFNLALESARKIGDTEKEQKIKEDFREEWEKEVRYKEKLWDFEKMDKGRRVKLDSIDFGDAAVNAEFLVEHGKELGLSEKEIDKWRKKAENLRAEEDRRTVEEAGEIAFRGY